MPVSRGRKRKKDNGRTAVQRQNAPALYPVPDDDCSCPICTGEVEDPGELVDALAADAGDLVEIEDPIEAEVMGALLLSSGELLGPEFEEALVGGLLPGLEARAGTEALALLLALGAVAEGEVHQAATAAAGRLVAAGTTRPAWAAELDEPVTVGECWHVGDPLGIASVLAGTFRRAGRSHGFLVTVDHLDCGAASEIALLDGNDLAGALDDMCAGARRDGVDLVRTSLDPADFRGRVEKALATRADHDRDELESDPGGVGLPDADTDDDGEPPYEVMATLLRSRLRTLPQPPRESTVSDHAASLPAKMLAQLVPRLGASPFDMPPGRRRRTEKLLPKRKKADGPAPIYQIKVSLRGAKPPIWRRLEVPANISLARLHRVIQAAFGWTDSHLHAFETPYGDFGIADPAIGHRAEAPVSLEQVAPAEKSKIRYTYDFGDDWEHEIVVEKILARESKTSYPRCTGGRRAAPPEDCGGIYGYAELLEVLADPDDPEHDDRLEWLGIDTAAEFDPAAFDVQEVNRRLSALR
ncbi:plasmid pRiA4b ORF-3 family protein [Gandjariella thermophila]|nr:plasmid pRiA4b ORF-3 family protein [Gandjariella thermophila]